jgi:peptidoglycan/xylan/chitin deacetylase (PgdA/CDA1 family)
LISRRSFLKMMGVAAGGWFVPFRQGLIPVPPSVMLHARQDHLDNLARLLDWLRARDYTPITYRVLWDTLTAGGDLPLRPVILSIDDLVLVKKSNNFDFIEKMVNILIEQQVAAVLAINTEPLVEGVDGQVVRLTDQDDTLWAKARTWAEQGIELATHTQSHRNLDDARMTADDYHYEIGGSAQIIADRTGQTVITLVLPYGNGTIDGQHDAPLLPPIVDECRRSGIGMVVGVAGGRVPLGPQPAAAQPVYFVGRVGPERDHFDTLYGDIDYWRKQNSPGQASDLP